jgi:polyprenyldihydroxybenzoate methyltransferase/3-demethylubiquinol 3-O-methyltransferase
MRITSSALNHLASRLLQGRLALSNSILPAASTCCYSYNTFSATATRQIKRSYTSSNTLSFRMTSTSSLSSSSLDESEIEKFNKVGDDWWNEGSLAGTGPLHAMNPPRVEFIRSCIASKLNRASSPYHKQIKGLRILDVGCGGGLLSESLARLGAVVTGIDLAQKSIEVAKRHSQLDKSTQNINYRCISIQDLANANEKFDVVCCLEVLEHVDNKAEFIANLAKCTADGGSLFVSTINRTRKSYAIAIAGAEYIAQLLPAGTHDWKSFITPEEMRIFLQSTGLTVNDMNGIVFDAEKAKKGLLSCNVIQFKLSDNDLDINYIMHAVK